MQNHWLDKKRINTLGELDAMWKAGQIVSYLVEFKGQTANRSYVQFASREIVHLIIGDDRKAYDPN